MQLVPHDPRWPARYRFAARRLIRLIGPHMAAVHHIGSTAVRHLCAKPTIDICVEVRDMGEEMEFIPPLVQAGYQQGNDRTFPFRRFLMLKAGNRRLEHIHIVEAGHPFVTRHLLFRDALRADENTRREYCELKRRLAAQGLSRSEYTEAKTAFIRRVERLAYIQVFGEEADPSLWE